MQNALLVGLSRQVALAREMDVIANNLANMNTSGFKADGAVFEEYVSPTARATNFPAADSRISFVHDRATWMDLSQGPLERTGNPLDVAVSGKGYLVVQTPRGERYTRNGALQINNSGELVTAEGFQVVGESGPITFQPKDRNITISQDGTISVRDGNNAQTESQRGQLRLGLRQRLLAVRSRGHVIARLLEIELNQFHRLGLIINNEDSLFQPFKK